MDDRVKCTCPDWSHQVYVIERLVTMASIRAGKDIFEASGGKRFKGCPWCGSKLTADSADAGTK